MIANTRYHGAILLPNIRKRRVRTEPDLRARLQYANEHIPVQLYNTPFDIVKRRLNNAVDVKTLFTRTRHEKQQKSSHNNNIVFRY